MDRDGTSGVLERALSLYRGLRRRSALVRSLHGILKFILKGYDRLIMLACAERWSATLRLILEGDGANCKGIIIFVSPVDWDIPLFQRPQHLAVEMARLGHLFFYCVPNVRYLKKDAEYRRIEERLYVTNMRDFLIEKLPNNWMFFYSTDPYISLRDVKRWKAFGHRIVYEYVDDISPEISSDAGASFIARRHNRLDQSLLDAVLAVSAVLYDEMASRFPGMEVLLHPNGVDYGHFHRGREFEDCPMEIRGLVGSGAPLVGYYGALARWIDYDAIATLAESRPEWNIVLIGWDYDGSMHALPKRKNIIYLGVIKYTDLPRYAVWFDAALIPFRRGEVAKATSPIKLYEYMAMNKPVVVSGDLVECARYDGVFVAADGEDFVLKVEEALKMKDSPDLIKRLDDQAKDNTWRKRAVDIDNLISSPAFSRREDKH